MSNFDGILTPVAAWDDVPQASDQMQLLGGPGGPLNAQAQRLLNRTAYLLPRAMTDNDIAVAAGRYLAPGRQVLPPGFDTLGINVYQDASGAFFTDFSESNYDENTLVSPTTYYVSPTGSSGNTGLSSGSPKGSLTEMLNWIYANPPAGDIIISVADGTYRRGRSAAGNSNFLPNKRYVIKAPNKAVLSSFENAGEVAWTASGGVYSGARSGVLEVFDFKRIDPWGIPARYDRKDTLAECQAQKGSFYTDNVTAYINPLDGSTVGTDVLALLSSSTPFWYFESGTKVFTKNLQFVYTQTTSSQTGSLRLLNMGLAAGTQFVGVNCRYFGNYGNGFTSYAIGLCINKGAVSAWCGGDGMNYHDDVNSPISAAIEIDCASYGHGLRYRPYGETKNNGSTAHDRMRMMRVNTIAWETAGPVIADVNGLKSLNFGCTPHSSLLDKTSGGELRVASAWCFDDTGMESPSQIWLIGCGGGGSKNFAISAQTGSPNISVSVRDWRGSREFSGNINLVSM